MAMRFKLSDSFRVDINFTCVDAKGKKENLSFAGIFKRLPLEEAKELWELSQKPGTTDIDLLKAVMTGWVMIDADTKDPVAFTPETLDEFCKIPNAAGLTMLKYFETNGVAREKN